MILMFYYSIFFFVCKGGDDEKHGNQFLDLIQINYDFCRGGVSPPEDTHKNHTGGESPPLQAKN